MRDVEVTRFVRATRPAVLRALTPERMVEYEGSFVVRNVEKLEDGWLVSAGSSGLEMALRFEEREDGLSYEQAGEAGPFAEMWTTVDVEPENEGVRVTARSGVGLPLPLTDRIAAWKRRGELKRALANLAEDVE